MRKDSAPAMLRSVESQTVRLVVELQPGEPLCGSAALEGRPPVEFEGMLGFLALFERLRLGPRDHETGATEDP